MSRSWEGQEEYGLQQKESKEVLKSTLEDLDASESEGEEEANLCLMENSVEYSWDDFDEEVDFSDHHFVIQANFDED